MNEDELLALNATLQEENESLKNLLSMTDFPPNEQLTSEKNFAMLSGKDEIPAKYKEVFDYMMPPSMQWMLITSKDEEEYWVDLCIHSFDTYLMYNPNCGFNEHDRQEIMILVRKRLNRAYQGFERTQINTQIQEINYQTAPKIPETTKKTESLLSRLNPFRK